MDFFDVAKQMEQDAVRFYKDLAAKAPVPQLKGVFTFMAQEEQRHFDLFGDLQRKVHPAPIREPSVLTKAREEFAKVRETFSVPATVVDTQDMYAKALEQEKHAVAYYTAESAKVNDSRQKGDLVLIIEQEKQHVRLIDGLIEFVRRPKEWVENAEFNNLDQY